MVDTVRSQTLHDSLRNVVMQFTNISDGTGEAAVLKVDVSTLSSAPARVDIDKITYTTTGMGVRILWDATTDDLAWELPANTSDTLEFRDIGGLQNPKSSGWTGDIRLTTIDHTSGDVYTIVLHMTKKAD